MGKKICFEVGIYCEHCNKALEHLENIRKKDLNCYGTFNKITHKYVKGIILRPNYNICGVVTSWHIFKEG